MGQQILVDPNYTVEELIQDILVNSDCAETFNYRSSTGTVESVNGIGYFNSNGSNFSYQEGIIISTGNAVDAEGPNIFVQSSGTEAWLGDSDLTNITGTRNLFNASYISFNFISLTNRMSFNFLFASEEYQDDFQCTFSDVFAFILTDSNGNSTNLALVPGTEDLVSATTIRPGISGLCEAKNIGFYGRSNNDDSAISMAGMTRSMVASSEVTPGEVYSIKLVIADNLDAAFDSAVFLEGSSFSTDIGLGEDRTVRNGQPLCIGETYELDATSTGALSYQRYRNNQRLSQFDDASVIAISQDGIYSVIVEFSSTCSFSGLVEIEYIPAPQVESPPLDILVCDFDQNGNEAIDLTQNDALILGNQDTEIYQVYYYHSQSEAANFENEIARPNRYFLSQNQETIYARISSGNSCYEIAPFIVNLIQISFETSLEGEYWMCVDEEGFPMGDLPVLDTGLSAMDYSFIWYYNSYDAEGQIQHENDNTLSAMSPGLYLAEVTNLQYGCSTLLLTSVSAIPPPALFEVDILSDLFSDVHAVSIGTENNDSYMFAIDDGTFVENPIFENLVGGKHTAHIQNIYGCEIYSQDFIFVDYPRFFTPNGDGINDIWKIDGLTEIQHPEITIYDRFGVIQQQFQGEVEWDGTRNGNRVLASDYWFKITYENAEGIPKEYKSHFTLKR
ncbi:MAG: choice-of-anchor L domain-containing protein [Flavobacteriaceae bacterium]